MQVKALHPGNNFQRQISTTPYSTKCYAAIIKTRNPRPTLSLPKQGDMNN
jgi:hypothetical protein